MDGDDPPSVIWWKESVIGIEDGEPHPNVLGMGLIKYVSYKNYPPTSDTVEFLHGHYIRVADYFNEKPKENPQLF